ncbi:tryptophan synthase subunit beta [Sulfitobacter sp. EE-36]|nr:tryptophan synthase subunit beta [Sulfitobacter sp. EE-36]
MEVLLALGDQP